MLFSQRNVAKVLRGAVRATTLVRREMEFVRATTNVKRIWCVAKTIVHGVVVKTAVQRPLGGRVLLVIEITSVVVVIGERA